MHALRIHPDREQIPPQECDTDQNTNGSGGGTVTAEDTLRQDNIAATDERSRVATWTVGDLPEGNQGN